ncbi:MAG: riboflavin biosynthesis protein RibF [Deltaproteobacteria bacterium HGW-Deltaproteobacteria-15]|jgi:riboflavin kinase/FMN adenylyltransferase|nr:MAG: riboflavin biosynthesis protein RibF [Deltaproteobacteria bacterium HGW-Deltaproteobacteria-15]
MNVIYDLDSLKQRLNNPVLTIGNFDGVHKGHLALFDIVKKRAQSIGGQSAVMTFDPHPVKIIKKGNGPALITQTEQKLCLISKAGIDVILCIPFTAQFASIPAESFVKDILLDKIGVKELVVGYDYTFGRNRTGNLTLLQKMGKELGFQVHLVGPVHIDHTVVSSTSIRTLVREGNLAEARMLLGRDYQIWGTVVKGANRGGRLLGFPTANIKPGDELLPKRGVYAVMVEVDERLFCGVTNVGFNPTFGENSLSIETYILDFSEDILGKKIKIKFLHRIRDEKTFGGVKELTDQIALDVQEARRLLSASPGARCQGGSS